MLLLSVYGLEYPYGFFFAIIGRIQAINRIQDIRSRYLCRPWKQCKVLWLLIALCSTLVCGILYDTYIYGNMNLKLLLSFTLTSEKTQPQCLFSKVFSTVWRMKAKGVDHGHEWSEFIDGVSCSLLVWQHRTILTFRECC